VNVYFSCSLTGGRADQSVYARIVEALLAAGHDVPTAHLAEADVMDQERQVDADTIYQRDIAWIEACDAVVAEVSTPSHGVGYEIAYALARSKPVLCCYRAGARVSKMITGNHSPGLEVKAYRDEVQAVAQVTEFLADFEAAQRASADVGLS
jgi:nucleoside 2-deoxyribosyltransferase